MKREIDLVEQAHKLIKLVGAARDLGINYVFIDKGLIADEVLNGTIKILGYSVVVGQGECARVKISW